MTVTPDTPQTIEGVTVSEPNEYGTCAVELPHVGLVDHYTPDEVRAMGLTVPEPTVECSIGGQKFWLTRAEARAIEGSRHRHCVDMTAAMNGSEKIADALRAHLDADSEARR